MDCYNETLSNETSKNVTFFSENIGYNSLALAWMVPSWSMWGLVVFVIIAITIGVPGNSLVMLVLLKVKQKTSTDWFVIFIALCDLVSVSINGSLYIVTFTLELPVTGWANIVCKLHIYIIHFLILESSFLITCVGLDRYFKTCKPHTVFFTPKSSLYTCMITLIVSGLFNISHFFTTKLNINGMCTLDNSKTSLRMGMYGVLLAIFLCISVAICVMYGMVAVKIRNRMKVVPIRITCRQSNCDSRGSGNTRTNATVFSLATVPEYSQTNVKPFRLKQPLSFGRRGPVSVDKSNRNMVVSSISTENHRTLEGLVSMTSSMRETAPTTIEMTELTTQNMPYRKRHIQNTVKTMDVRSRKIIKTTQIMVAITVVFVLSTVMPAVAVAILTVIKDIKHQTVGRVVIFWMLRLHLINNITNLLFYICLSSAFRERASETICKIFKT